MTTQVSLPLTQLRHHLVSERHSRGWSQQCVADLIGTTQLNVSRWERGYTTPNPYFRSRLAHLFGLTIAELGIPPRMDDEVPPRAYPLESNKYGETISEPFYDMTIPQPTIPVVGRAYELAQLKMRLLIDHQGSLSALHGLPGVGKTSLILELITDNEVRAHFSQGILWAALGPHPDVLAILSRWGRLLGVNEKQAAQLHTTEDWMKEAQNRIAMQQLLLVLDDVWDLETALMCKVGGPRCAHVLTTRLPQIALAFAPEGTLPIKELPASESIQLLRQLAPDVVQSEYEQVRALAEIVGGLPMALALIGNYLRLQSHSGQPRRIHTALTRLLDTRERLRLSVASTLLKTPSRLLEPPMSVEATIAISDQHLSLQAHAALLALSIFPPKPESFSEEDALAISQVEPGVLDELSDAGLLETVASGCYTLPRTIADYAHNHLNGY